VNNEGYSMSTFLISAGGVLTLVGVLLLSGAEDLLPLELWAWLHGVPAEGHYFRGVPADESHSLIEFTLLGIGTALAMVGWILRRRRNTDA